MKPPNELTAMSRDAMAPFPRPGRSTTSKGGGFSLNGASGEGATELFLQYSNPSPIRVTRRGSRTPRRLAVSELALNRLLGWRFVCVHYQRQQSRRTRWRRTSSPDFWVGLRFRCLAVAVSDILETGRSRESGVGERDYAMIAG